MKKYDKGEIAEIILNTLLVVGTITIAITAPNAFQVFKYFEPKTAPERNRIEKSIARLKRQQFIKGDRGGYYTLTAKGKMKALRRKIETTRITAQEKWDEKWRLVMFDVPEEKKAARRAINYALKKIGCAQYQKSVFITPYPCEKEIDFIGECFGVRANIKIILAERVEGDKIFKTKFKL